MSKNVKKEQQTMQEQLKSLIPHMKSIDQQRKEKK